MLGKQIQPFALAQPQLENEILGRYLVLWLLESCRGCGKRLPLGLTHSLVFLQQVLKGQYNNQKTPVASVSSLELQPEPSKHHPWSCDNEETPPDLHAPPLLSSFWLSLVPKRALQAKSFLCCGCASLPGPVGCARGILDQTVLLQHQVCLVKVRSEKGGCGE